MPVTFPSHQGLILPLARRWPNSFDALALSVGAAMPDITDSILGFPLNGYFKQWYGHSLIGIFTLDLALGVCMTWTIAVLAGRFFTSVNTRKRFHAFFPKALSGMNIIRYGRSKLRLWTFSVLVGILSHILFDLISHDTNLLLYPWNEHVHWFPQWWYIIWFEFPAIHAFGRPYAFGVFSLMWGALSVLGAILFVRFVIQTYENRMPYETNPEEISNPPGVETV